MYLIPQEEMQYSNENVRTNSTQINGERREINNHMIAFMNSILQVGVTRFVMAEDIEKTWAISVAENNAPVRSYPPQQDSETPRTQRVAPMSPKFREFFTAKYNIGIEDIHVSIALKLLNQHHLRVNYYQA